MDEFLLYLLTACLLGGAPLVTEARHNCSNCTNVWPRLPCTTHTDVCDIPLDRSKPEVGAVRNVVQQKPGFYWSGDKNAKPMLEVSWEIPQKGYQNVTGFLIKLYAQSTRTICYHLDMENARWTEQDDTDRLRLSFDCLLVHWDTTYFLTILTLPNQRDTSPSLKVGPYRWIGDGPPKPSEWIASIEVIKHEANDQLDVQFKPYNHPVFTITRYRVELLCVDYPENTLSAIVTEYNVSMSIAFYNVCIPGIWRATVQPLEMANYCMDRGESACLDQNGECRHCKKSTTEYFKFNPANPCLTVPEDMMILAIVLGICAGCLVASLLVALAMYYNKACGEPPLTPNQSESPQLLPRPNNTVRVQGKPITVKSKRVLILYEEDHPLHTSAVHHLANFLQHHCKCDVIFDQWDTKYVRKDSIGWLLKYLDESDQIIVIHSEGGYKRYQMKKNAVQSDRPTSPKIGLFVSGVEKLINERMDGSRIFESSKKTVSVYMPYTPRGFVIWGTSSQTYELMKDLDKLVRHIHRVTSSDVVMKGISPKVCHSSYSELADGQHLKAAIDKMSRFVRQNPTWFPEVPAKIVKDEETSSDYGTIENSNQSSMRGNSVSSRPAEALLEVTGEDPVSEEKVELEEKEELPTYKDNLKTAEQRESITSSRVALLTQSFEQNSLPRNNADKSRLNQRTSKASKKSDSSVDNLESVPEVLYAQPLPKSARSSKASYKDIVRAEDGMASTRSASEASRAESCASTEPLYADVKEKDTPGAGRKSVKDYDAYIDDTFKDLCGQSTGEPES